MMVSSSDRQGRAASRLGAAFALASFAVSVACGKAERGAAPADSSSGSGGTTGSPGVTSPDDSAAAGSPASRIEDLTWTAPSGAPPIDLRIAVQAGGGVPAVNPSGGILLAQRDSLSGDATGAVVPILTARSSDGGPLWSTAYAADARLFPAFLSDGSVLVAADFRGQLDLGGAQIESFRNPEAATGSGFFSFDPYARGELSRDVGLFRLDPEGLLTTSLTFGGPGDQMPRAATLSPAGALVIAGVFFGELVMGEQRVTSTNGATSPDAFVARLDSAGSVTALARLDLAHVDAICVDHTHAVWVAGRGPGGLAADVLGAHRVLKVTADGDVVESLFVSDDDIVSATGITCGTDGSVYVLYSFASNASLFGTERRSAGALAALSSDGGVRWLARLDGDFTSGTLASDPDGNIAIAGAAAPRIDLGEGPLAAGRVDEIDMFFASFTPDGGLRYAFRIGGPGSDGAEGVVAIASSRWLVSFYLSDAVVVEGQRIEAGKHLLWIDER